MEDLFKIHGIVNLKKGEGRTLKAGGMWVYDNEIASTMVLTAILWVSDISTAALKLRSE